MIANIPLVCGCDASSVMTSHAPAVVVLVDVENMNFAFTTRGGSADAVDPTVLARIRDVENAVILLPDGPAPAWGPWDIAMHGRHASTSQSLPLP
jgi:hypothetical protein